MNFKEIIKQEWEAEFNPGEYEEPVEPYGFESSIFQMYNSMVERICIKVWNKAVEDCANNAEAYKDIPDDVCYVDKDSILKLKL